MAYDQGLAARVRALLRGPIVERRMMGGLCFMAGDHMCCGVLGNALMVRVGHNAAVADAHVRPFEIGGRRTAGFILVDQPGIRTPAGLKGWVERGLAVAASLPPKKSQGASRR